VRDEKNASAAPAGQKMAPYTQTRKWDAHRTFVTLLRPQWQQLVKKIREWSAHHVCVDNHANKSNRHIKTWVSVGDGFELESEGPLGKEATEEGKDTNEPDAS